METKKAELAASVAQDLATQNDFDTADDVKELKTTFGPLDTAVKAIEKKLRGNGAKYDAQEKKRATAKKQLPFSLVHPGNWKGESRGVSTSGMI